MAPDFQPTSIGVRRTQWSPISATPSTKTNQPAPRLHGTPKILDALVFSKRREHSHGQTARADRMVVACESTRGGHFAQEAIHNLISIQDDKLGPQNSITSGKSGRSGSVTLDTAILLD